MAKSIGTLKATLILDSKGLTKGLLLSEQELKKWYREYNAYLKRQQQMQRERMMALMAAASAVAAAIYLAMRAAKFLVREFVSFQKESAFVNATVESFKALHKEVRSTEQGLADALAPALTMVFESLAENLAMVKAAFNGFKPLLNEIAGTAIFTANVIDAASDLLAAALSSDVGKAVKAQLRIANLMNGKGIELPKTWAVPLAVEEAKAAASSKPSEPLRLSPLERGTQEAAEAIMRMRGGTGNTMSKEGVATIEQLKKIEANTRKRGAVIKEGRV